MNSFGTQYRALVIGSSGGIGGAFVQHLQSDNHCVAVEAIHRQSVPTIDFADENSIADAAQFFAEQEKFHLILVATGVLHSANAMPEKKLGDLHYAQLMHTFQANTFGPALVIRHFAPLLHADRAVLAVLSAKVGSIEDNRLGGWYSYRASKAALNMLLKTAAIEVKRTKPNAVLVAMHPGTVNSGLSKPFKGETLGRPAFEAAGDMLAVLDGLKPDESGVFCAYDGARLPW